MCGITGLWDLSAAIDPVRLSRYAAAMNETLRHRGPDDDGVWLDPNVKIALAQRRLSIIDTSPAGHQPMHSSCGRYAVVYNGELYNAQDIRAPLSALGRAFRGQSDTEVLVEGFSQWGIEETIRRAFGMFAIAVWDRAERRLSLVRDRIGIKPLYWGRVGPVVLFGSELKAIVKFNDWTPQINRQALTLYLRFGYVPDPHSIWENINKLPPGHIVSIDRNGGLSQSSYWSAIDVAHAGVEDRLRSRESEEQLTDRLNDLLLDIVDHHMVSDVPLGAFLSGGIDSSLVVALMQAKSARAVKTYAIGFRETAFNEAPFAAAIARHLGTDHTEFYVEPEHARAVIPDIPVLYDEPFADPSQIPTYLVSRMTRAHVTVALSGDGGDELFAGYARYRMARWARRWAGATPQFLRKAGAFALQSLPAERWSALAGALPLDRSTNWGDKLYKLADLLKVNRGDIYLSLISNWADADKIVKETRQEVLAPVWGKDLRADFPDDLDHMQLVDLLTYLPGDILTKLDRASMAASLEARVPLLDHRVIEFAWGLPQWAKERSGTTKWLLRRVLYRYVPASLVDRPKMGFAVPIGAWLRGPLRDWAEALLDEKRLVSEGFFEPEPIRKAWAGHMSGSRNLEIPLWTVLMFQAWLSGLRQGGPVISDHRA